MINSNVTRALSEVLESHHIEPRTGERLADAVARALHLSGPESK